MKIGLLGCGTVGSGVYELLTMQKEGLYRLYGEEIAIKKILVKNRDKPRGINEIYHLLTTDPYEILDDPDIDLVVEVLGGVTDAYEYINYALSNGKHVVTANKAIVAGAMRELLELAEKNNKAFLFEGSVGGGIPLLKPLKQCSLLNEFSEVKGILNGTSNFILTRMMEGELDFQEALELAKNLGYAEADPSDDIEGADVARKLAILSSIVFKDNVGLDRVKYRGIKDITKSDIGIVKDMGYSVKLLGKAVISNNEFSALVEPVLLRNTSLFENVKDAYNMVSVKGNNLAELRFYGEGAGKKATANAVVSDILDVLNGNYQREPILRNNNLDQNRSELICGKYFLRVTPKVTSDYYTITNTLKSNGIGFTKELEKSDIIILTENVASDTIDKVIKELEEHRYSIFFGRVEVD